MFYTCHTYFEFKNVSIIFKSLLYIENFKFFFQFTKIKFKYFTFFEKSYFYINFD